jgi:quercetin dioxygenase-like cupin family protein
MIIIDLKEKEVFKKEDRGFANLVEEKYLQINQVCLEPGQQVPQHNANSNVTLMVVHGEGTFHIGNDVTRMGPGKLLRVLFQSSMSIKNESKERLAFLVIKAPHPNEMK